MLWMLPVLLLTGLFLPGFFLAKYLRHQLWWASAFVLSLLVLFHSVFWLGVFGAHITLGTVLPCMVLTSAAAWMCRRHATPDKTPKSTPLSRQDRILLFSSGLAGLALLIRSAISPWAGFDSPWRWDFLAQRIFQLGRFDFYPPLTPADLRTYFYVDGIPPLVSFTNWWLYASAGRYLPWLICIFVTAQFVCTLAFTYGAASTIFSRRAGILAAAILAACPLYFRSVVIGQETGLTALSIAAMIYFIASARQSNDVPAMVAAGLAAALCALSREYGWIALIAGAVALLWRRAPLKQVLIFAAVAAAGAAPWYVRNWIRAGNPFYSLRLGDFAVNPIHDGILQYYKLLLGFQQWPGRNWINLLWLLLLYATFQILAGIPGGLSRFREHGYLMAMTLLFSAVWLQSAGYTSGGILVSTRVLSPAMVLLSITGAGILERLTQRAKWNIAVIAAVILCQMWTAGHGVFYPDNPLNLPLGQWAQNAFRRIPEPAEFQVRDQLAKILPARSRMLAENAGLHAALSEKGIDVVPVWSPEVRFLFLSPPEDAERQLRALNIGSVAYYPQSLNTRYLTAVSPFYAALPQRWRVLAQVRGLLTIMAERK